MQITIALYSIDIWLVETLPPGWQIVFPLLWSSPFLILKNHVDRLPQELFSMKSVVFLKR